MRLYCSLMMSSSTVFLTTPALQLSGTRMGVEPPKNENACTWAVTHDSSPMSGNASAKVRCDHGRQATNTHPNVKQFFPHTVSTFTFNSVR